MRPLRPSLLTCLATIVAWTTTASAQTAPRFQLDPIQPASPQSPFLVVEGPARADTSGARLLSAALLVDYARSPLTVHSRQAGSLEKVGSPVENSLIAHAGLGLQFTRALSVDLLAPVSLLQQGSDTTVGDTVIRAPASSVALGDVRAGILLRSWAQPWFGYALGVRTRMPTGNRDAYMGDGRWHPELLAGAFAQIDPARLGCTAFFGPGFAASKQGDRLAFGCAADVRVAAGGTSVGAEFLGAGLRKANDASVDSLFEIWATVRQPFGPLTAGLAAGPGMGTSPGTAALRAMATVSWAPQLPADKAPASDQDLDSIPDADDACPKEAGPKSTEPGRNGCPNLDSDGDGVADHQDGCPKNPGSKSSDPAISGCPDADNDGVVDKLDKCPSEPAEASGDKDTLGCPKRAHLRGDRFVVQPPLGPEPSASDASALQEIAFALRAMSSIRRVDVEVVLQGSDTDEELADRAVERAAQLVKQLIDLGVDRRRLTPVGAVSSNPAKINFTVTDKAPAPK
ncbi:MAG: thrombospondin type 3 repeat-containing protein [Deltaproteobacteria bacterium]|nr:thrombospondin type 3 repeat-containing protein [Deltaproteobacteria bacterium]